MDLSHEFLNAFFPLTKSFFLTGGNALNFYYFNHRFSEDLDCFTTEREEFEHLTGILDEVCRSTGIVLKSDRVFPNFRRYIFSKTSESIIVDFVYEPVKQLYPEKRMVDGVRVDVPEEMTVNKLCALLGRSEFKDLVDLFYLQKSGYPAIEYVEKAEQKEGGLSCATLAYVLENMDITRMPDKLKQSVSPEELELFRAELVELLLKSALPT